MNCPKSLILVALPIPLILPHHLSIDTSSLSSPGDIIFLAIGIATLTVPVFGTIAGFYQVRDELRQIKRLLSSKNQDKESTQSEHEKPSTK
jgi:TRAP-type C4-dicarboxylate transport system permease small subunit